MELKATIANINVCFNHIHETYFSDLYSEYLNDFAKEDLRLKFTKNQSTIPSGKAIFSDGIATLIEQNDKSRVYCNIADGNENLYSMKYNTDCSEIDIEISNKYQAKDVGSSELFEYIVSSTAFNLKLINSGGMMFHSSCIEFNDEAICFSAPSGTGKSTHTSLWKQVFGDKVRFINDDKPAIRFNENGKAIAYGLPYSGKNFINANISAPVKAVVFIERANSNSIRQIDGIEAVYKILNQTVKFLPDKEITAKLLDTVERFVTSVPTYILSCDISEDAVKVCYNELFKK